MKISRWALNSTYAVGIAVIAISTNIPATVYGEGVACAALFSTSSITPGTQSNLNLQINNESDTSSIAWIKVVSPNSAYTVSGASSEGWTANFNSDAAVFTNSLVGPGAAYNKLNLLVDASSNEAPPTAWTVLVSDNSSGANPSSCTNVGLDIAITDNVAPTISDVIVNDVTPESATITWTTDQPSTSQIQYGHGRTYGSSSPLNSSLKTNHSVTLSGLTPDTSYHFSAESADGAQTAATSVDSTFITAAKSPDSLQSSTMPNITTGSLRKFGIEIKAVPTERIRPDLKIITAFDKPYRQAPTITGTATDNEAVAVLEYSMNGGKDWLPVDTASGIGSKSVAFGFKPIGLDDGNYTVVVRAIDTSANTEVSPAATLIIDKLNPLVGGIVQTLGPQILTPGVSASIASVVGVDQKITLSAVGGPTSIVLTTQLTAKQSNPQTFNMTRSSETGLWSGIISFDKPGRYELTARAVDGAGNKTADIISTLQVASPARVLSKGALKPLDATITLFSYDPDTKGWVIWDGASYSQANPQTTNARGEFSLFLPAGKYYIQSQSSRHKTVYSRIFETKQSEPFSTDIVMNPLRSFGFGRFSVSLPNFGSTTITHGSTQSKSASVSQSTSKDLIGKPAPDFSLRDTDGKTVYTADLLGRPTVLSFCSTWAPIANEQLASLSRLQKMKDINVIPIAMQESAAKASAYTAIAGVQLRWLVDPDSSLSPNFGALTVPTHYFIDRKGVVKHVVVGVLSERQILDTLGSY